MKIRNGFVSNSSSSSFIIQKKFLSEHQIEQIYNHIEEWNKFCDENVKFDDEYEITKCEFYKADDSDRWDITCEGDNISGFTFMDNFSMYEFLERVVNVTRNHIKYDSY